MGSLARHQPGLFSHDGMQLRRGRDIHRARSAGRVEVIVITKRWPQASGPAKTPSQRIQIYDLQPMPWREIVEWSMTQGGRAGTPTRPEFTCPFRNARGRQ